MISGVVIESSGDCTLCRITHFSDELKQKIRSDLCEVIIGKAEVKELPTYYNYKNILIQFLDRYIKKPEETQKGMIGELISHILIPSLFSNLTSLSIYFNKEEQSIKKGFDIIYCDFSNTAIWYSEVKSGHKPATSTSSDTNVGLLNRAYVDLRDKLNESRSSLWASALIDVNLTIEASERSTVKQLLSNDSPLTNKPTSLDKNGLLVSVLFEDTANICEIVSLENYLIKQVSKKEFKNLILFSVQKKTFEAIAEFLKQEAIS